MMARSGSCGVEEDVGGGCPSIEVTAVGRTEVDSASATVLPSLSLVVDAGGSDAAVVGADVVVIDVATVSCLRAR